MAGNISSASAATTVTGNGTSDTVAVNATALANNTALTLAGSAAETVTGLIGNITAGALTGTLSVTTVMLPTTRSRSPPALRQPRSPITSATMW